jgi:hypothetical protein
MKFNPLSMLFVLALLHWGCKSNHRENTLLEIGKYKLLIEDYKLIKEQKTKGRIPPKELEERLIQEGYILADALENRYDTIGVLSERLDYAMRYQVAKVDGFLWNKKVKPQLTITDNDIQDAYSKRSNEYALEAIYFPYKKLIPPFSSPIASSKEFSLLKQRVASNPQIGTFIIEDTYPFFPFGAYTDAITNMKQGDILGPVQTSRGYFIFHLSAVKARKKNISFQQDRPAIKEALIKVLREKYVWENQKRIFNTARIIINDNVVNETASKYDIDKKQWLNPDDQKILMTYQFNEKQYAYKVSDLLHDYQYQPVFFGSLNNPLDVREFLKRYVIETYLFEEVSKLNADKEYVFLKKKQQEQIWLGYFNEQKIIPRLLVTDAEVSDYYNKNKKDFESFGQATVRVFKFKDGLSARRAYSAILSSGKAIKQAAYITYPGLLSTQTLVIKSSDTTLNENLIDVVSSQQGTNRLINIENESWIVQVLNKEGVSVLPLAHVRSKIKGILLSRKKQEVFNKQMGVLRAAYGITINRLSKM